jgi:NAD(P)-dependent dehydrogenase (short-subunit alcohol dehydrogenase family)
MLLENRIAIVYGGGGVIGAAVAHRFAQAGAEVHLAGRTRAKLITVAREIEKAGGRAEVMEVNALDERAVHEHADFVSQRAGRIDIAFNAVGVSHVQGIALAELTLEDYWLPVQVYAQAHFITAKAVGRHMMKQRSGVILTLSTPAGVMPGPGFLGHSVACAGIEALTRHLAGELGAYGVRVVGLRSHAIPETVARGSHALEVFGRVAALSGSSIEGMLADAATGTLLKRLPSLDQLTGTALFLASDQAGAMTGAIVNLTCGMILD